MEKTGCCSKTKSLYCISFTKTIRQLLWRGLDQENFLYKEAGIVFRVFLVMRQIGAGYN